MRVSTKALFNLISKTDDKNVKEALQKIISNKSELLKTELPNTRETPPKANVKELVNQLLKELSNNTKTKQNILQEIKHSDIPKLMKNTTTELKTLLNLIKSDKILSKFTPILEKLLVHVKDIKPETLKQELTKSGILMESKLASPKTEVMPAPLKEVLTSLKELLVKNLPKEDLKALHVKLLNTLLNTKKVDKNFVQVLQNFTKDIKTTPDLPKQILPLLKKLESFMQNSSTLKEINIKDILLNLKKTIAQNPKESNVHVKVLDTLLSTKKVDKNFVQVLQNLTKDIKTTPDLPKQVEPLLKELNKIVAQKTAPEATNLKELLTNIKQVLSKTSQSGALHVEVIEKILDAPKADKAFIEDIKTLITNLKQSKSVNKPVVQVVAKLEELVQKSSLVESKIQNNPKVMPKEIPKVVAEIKKILTELKELVKESKKDPILEPKSQEIAKLVEQTLKTTEFFPRELSKATITEKLQQVVNLIKSELVKTDVKNSLHVEVAKLANKLETVIKEQITTKQIVPNQKLQIEMPIKQELANDIKSTLLNIKHELSAQTTPMSREISLHVERLITQIEYFQLVSLSSNSQTSYLPFLWDGLEEGQVSLKKLKENRFFCEINLKLKEYGKIDLMLMLFDDVNLNISVFAEKKEFLELVQDNLPALKQGINKIGLIPSTVQLKKRELKDEEMNSSKFLGTGLNIEV